VFLDLVNRRKPVICFEDFVFPIKKNAEHRAMGNVVIDNEQ
jgi:hypothetical protein